MDKTSTLTVEQDGERLDRFVTGALPHLSRSFVHKLIELGMVTVSGRALKPSYRVQQGDSVTVLEPEPEPLALTPEAIPLSIVYEDGDLLIVDKPAGMVVHPAYGHSSGTLVNAVLAHCSDLSGINGVMRPGIVHRLDKDTSGLVIVAKNDAAMRDLQRQFKSRLVHKTYLALVEGVLEASHGIIDAPIGRDQRHRQRMAVVPNGDREARTDYRVLEYFAAHSLVEAEPVTGRTHQIRVHFGFIGHPLVGDTVYGYRHRSLPLQRQFLHAARIRFTLPGTGRPVEFVSELPPDLRAVLESL
jgi:23S rRNA pseudouridine1911/1915/1917 synthase